MAQINKPTDYFNTVLFTGNGSTQSVTGVNFQPDWVWIKDRVEARDHKLTDVVRGVTKALRTNGTTAEETDATGLTSFDTDGFTLGGGYNRNGNNIASWNWLADNTSGSSNTQGSITSTVSVNTTSGFSIVSYTGTGANATVGHGLGVAPDVIITKNRTSAGSNWVVLHKSIFNSSDTIVALNSTDASYTQGTANYQGTNPTSSVFYVGTGDNTNKSTNNIISYCFAEKKGFSKFGSYTGNGSTDGTFVYTGFKPAFVIIKRTDSTGSWVIEDSVRSPSNSSMKVLYANLSNAEETLDPYFDLLSNGFKIRWTSTFINASGGTYIYMAFAENPLVGTNNIPTTAR